MIVKSLRRLRAPYWTGPHHPDIAQRLDEFLGTGDLITRMAAEARQEVHPQWFRPWTEIEQEATSLRCYEQGIIPGLLQTEAYARAALTAGLFSLERAEQGAALRIERQVLLDRADPPLTTFVIDEAALRRGDSAVLKEQLLHLVEIGQRPLVLIHVVPTSAGAYIGQSGPFTIATTEDGGTQAFLEDQVPGAGWSAIPGSWPRWNGRGMLSVRSPCCRATSPGTSF